MFKKVYVSKLNPCFGQNNIRSHLNYAVNYKKMFGNFKDNLCVKKFTICHDTNTEYETVKIE